MTVESQGVGFEGVVNDRDDDQRQQGRFQDAEDQRERTAAASITASFRSIRR